MSLTINESKYDVFGIRQAGLVDISFDSSYAYGGESLAPEALGLGSIARAFFESVNGITFEYDRTNKKLKAYAPAPAIVYEEKHTAVGNSVTLDYPAAWIINVTKAGANQQWSKTGLAAASLGTNQFCLSSAIADGVRTQLTTKGETDVIYVTYITQAWQELYKCLVQEEAVTAATGDVTLTSGNKVMAYGYVYQTAATAELMKPTDPATAAGDGLVGIKFNSATAQINFHSDQNGKACVYTYLKLPASGFLADRFVADEDPTKAGGDPYTQTFNLPLLMWGISGFFLVNNAAPVALVEENCTPAAGYANLNWGYRGPAGTGAAPASGFVIGGKDNVTCTAGAYLFGHPWEIPGLVPLEVKDGTDLSFLRVKGLVLGD